MSTAKHYPGSTSRPVPSHSGPMSAHLGLVLHVTTNHASPYGYFSDPKNEASSTWWVADTGQVEEYVCPDLMAWAQAAGNGTYNSVETSGTPDTPLTPAQVEAVAQIYAWGHLTYGWPFALASKPGDRGLGWHGMGGAAWGGHTGCPGDKRKAQRATILKRAQAIVATPPAKPAPKAAPKPAPVKAPPKAPPKAPDKMPPRPPAPTLTQAQIAHLRRHPAWWRLIMQWLRSR